MAGYILSVLGIVVAGIIIDIVIPSGNINKYIKSIYAIFVVAVLISPIVNFVNKNQGFNFNVENYEINEPLMNYINKQKAAGTEKDIENYLKQQGLNNIDIKLNFSLENNQLIFNSCLVNLKNMEITLDNQHINIYEFIRGVVKEYTNLTDEGIMFDE